MNLNISNQTFNKVAQMVEPEAAYGRALLSYLTGMRFQSPPHYNQNVAWNTKVSQKKSRRNLYCIS